MKTRMKIAAGALATLASLGGVGCKMDGGSAIKLTIWVSEADKPFAEQVVTAFKEKNADKTYQFTIDIQGENDVATRVLKDVENSADVYSFVNDQLPKLVNGDALARIAGDRWTRLNAALDEVAMDSATLTVNGEQATFGMPYTDNTFFLYYDKSALTETDVQSLDGILSKCSSTKQFAFPFTDGWYSTSFYFGKGLGFSVEYDENLAESKITCDFGNETGTAVTQAMWSYVQDSRVKADVNDSKITAGFQDGSVVAAVTGIWNKTAIEKSLGENFAAAKLPTYTFRRGGTDEEQTQMISFAGYKLMGVNNYSKNKTEAMEFAEFYVNEENQVKHFETRGFVPTDKAARLHEKIQSDICAKAITEQLKHSKTQKDVPSTMWVPMEGLGSAMVTGAQSGSFDLAAQLKACVASIEKK